MNELLQLYIELLKWDIEVMSQTWMYLWAFVPILIFLPFFFMKWVVLTAPIWLPIGMIFSATFRKK